MKVIALPAEQGEAQNIFGIMRTAAFQGDGAKNHADSRNLGKLQDDLEAVSHDAETDGVAHRALNDGVTELRLEDARWELLKGRIFGANIAWHALAARRVAKAYDLVAEAVEEKKVVQKAEEAEEAKPTKKKR